MRTLSLILFFSVLCTLANAQKSKPIHPPTKIEGDILEKRMDCIFRNTYTSTERLKFFPFNKYKKIVLISFEWPGPARDRIIANDGTVTEGDTIPDLSTKEKRQSFYKSITKEEILLKPEQINQLTNILYNYGVKSTKSYHGVRSVEISYNCYEPRNAIIFLDDKGILAEYIELCFECNRREVSSEKIKLNDFCNQKYEIIKKLFQALGISYVSESK